MRIGTESIPAEYSKVKTNFGYVFYKFFNEKRDKESAKNRCALDSYLLHLPIPRNQEENDFFQGLSQIYGRNFWLGINYEKNEGNFVGDDESKIEWFNWYNEQPDNFEIQNNVRMIKYGFWRDVKQDVKLSFICSYIERSGL